MSQNQAGVAVRAAKSDDIPKIVELCEAERRRYEVGYANFYAVAPDYAQKKTESVAQLIDSDNALALVHETGGQIDGLILGRLVNAPPVYNPGGMVCLIEDFLVASPQGWPKTGAALEKAANERVRQLGGVLLVVESMHTATSKRDLLLSTGFNIASDWFCRDIDLFEPGWKLVGEIEPATLADVPALVDLCERRRMQYQRYQPIFWRKAADAADKQRPYLSWLIADGKSISLVHRTNKTIDGFIIANPSASSPFFDRHGPSCNIDDFTVADDSQWQIGSWLLYTATTKAKSMGAVCSQVICGDADLSKRRMLDQMGYQIGHEWLVRPVQ